MILKSLLDRVDSVMDSDEIDMGNDIKPILYPDEYSKSEMQSIYDRVLGYDPITIYDKMDITSHLNQKLSNTTLENINFNDIYDDIVDIIDDVRETLTNAIINRYCETLENKASIDPRMAIVNVDYLIETRIRSSIFGDMRTSDDDDDYEGDDEYEYNDTYDDWYSIDSWDSNGSD